MNSLRKIGLVSFYKACLVITISSLRYTKQSRLIKCQKVRFPSLRGTKQSSLIRCQKVRFPSLRGTKQSSPIKCQKVNIDLLIINHTGLLRSSQRRCGSILHSPLSIIHFIRLDCFVPRKDW